MADSISSVEIAINDITRTLAELRSCKDSPVDVRRNFSTFINLSQAITSYMRRDYLNNTSSKWEAKEFYGWNDVTELFKELRNVQEHEDSIILRIDYTWFHDLQIGGQIVEMEMGGYWEWDNPLDDTFSEELKVYDRPPEEEGAKEIKPKRIEVAYHLNNMNSKICRLIESIGFSDIHKLSESCHDTLVNYVQFYNQKMQSHSPDG